MPDLFAFLRVAGLRLKAVAGDPLCGDAFMLHLVAHFVADVGVRTFSRHFGILHGSKHVITGSKRAKNTCLSIPSGLGTTLEKKKFFYSEDPGGPTIGPHCARAGLPSGSTK